ncbi:cell wall metabolism sensor histidine kinase WalK [Maritimibacter sp. DP1N21-5]|uniref:sensor histidine kinase n=1 Tax=Maritimibacter sp. DP1N21-5 TaxID=2836867 RepID=UPI001C43911B|nr:ATP-binding protein [Maritimibacter sp. DP1N21-5]MBV7409831.1 PAS domain-containing protein [Maritimibacter sp. DP1N21-5]
MTVETLVKALPIPCAVIDRSMRVTVLNDGASALFGRETLGRPAAAVFRQPALLDPIERAMATGSAGTGKHLAVAANQRERVFEVRIAPYEGGLVLSFQDQTATAEAGERRSEFVANVSHELRTPLTAISGFIETLRGPARDDAVARDQFLEIMEREARRMNRLVDDLLSLAKVEDLERLRPTEDEDIAELVESAARSLRGLAAEKGVELTVKGAETPVFLPADADQMTQVFTNLIENAIKYGGSGGIVTVSVETVDSDPRLRGPGIIVTVADRGEGIDERHLGRLTERFYRIDSHRSRGMGGTGLGLAIVKHIVNRHRGRLRIESKVGQGSRFSVLLPKS